MSSKAVPIFDNPGFFGGAKICEEDAPQDVVENYGQPMYDYYAVLIKETGYVDARDFFRFAKRFTTLCFQVYKRAKIELRADSWYPFNFSGPPGYETWSSRRPQFRLRRAGDRLSYEWFLRIFSMSYSIGMRITMRSRYWSDFIPHAEIEWNKQKPSTIFLSAHRGYPWYPRTGNGQLEHLLLRKLFYVPDTPPDHDFNFSVFLGLDAYEEERNMSSSDTR